MLILVFCSYLSIFKQHYFVQCQVLIHLSNKKGCSLISVSFCASKKKILIQGPFRHMNCFKSICLSPTEKTQTIPNPSFDWFSCLDFQRHSRSKLNNLSQSCHHVDEQKRIPVLEIPKTTFYSDIRKGLKHDSAMQNLFTSC